MQLKTILHLGTSKRGLGEGAMLIESQGHCLSYLGRFDGQIITSKPLQVFFQQSLGIIFSDLLAGHFLFFSPVSNHRSKNS